MALGVSVPMKVTPQRDHPPSPWRCPGAPRPVQTCLGRTTETFPRSPGWARPLAPWHHAGSLAGSLPTKWLPRNPRQPPNGEKVKPSNVAPAIPLIPGSENNKGLFSDRFYSIGKQPFCFPMSFVCVFLLFLYSRAPRFRATSRTNDPKHGKPAIESQSFP